MIRPTATAAVSRAMALTRAPGDRLGIDRRHLGVQAELVGDAIEPVGVVVVGHQHGAVHAPWPRAARVAAASCSQVFAPCSSRRIAASGTPRPGGRRSWRPPR